MQLVDYGTNLKQNVLEFVPLDSFFFCLFVCTRALVLSNCDSTVLSEKEILKVKTFENYPGVR